MKPSKLLATLATLTMALGLSFSTASQAQGADKLPNYVPVLPLIKARALAVDPQKGYLVKQVKPDVYVITDGIYQSAFVTTGKGVILFDAPESFAQYIVKAVADVTKEPIAQLVYSHAHLDHIAGAGLLVKQVPKLTIVAEADTAAFLREKKDPRRPIPTRTFKDHLNLKLGTMVVECWAYIEAANYAKRFCPEIQRWYDRKLAASNKMIAIKATAHKLARASYFLMRDGGVFDAKRACG